MATHVFGNRPLSDLDPQHQQLAVDPWCTPPRVLAAHASNQVSDLAVNLRSTTTPPGFPVPIGLEAAPVPANNGFRLDHGGHIQKGRKIRYSQTRTSRSRFRSRTRDRCLRLRINTCWRSTRFSVSSQARERSRDRTMSQSRVRNADIARSTTTVGHSRHTGLRFR